mmetsp:Transcript_7488/g.20233  ORF Transcript_7488/g.20233 Transcript_7488/m.20233 type:complete len:274 (-) Transcript_7488:236-1057(-)|eukprot:CAMPEP_0198116696 /NCGR_PEP_ID=MMETSP1442-20131203/14077_1 /TAXON_ID= /ORGANISM="Craspedostauros australis, Strain CCMP3328" /LENGTH=273 /DNA_ID=CAMNT_0043774583 /DNA_START=105 /DNA_END=926 /DNA_ORIENTATION=+
MTPDGDDSNSKSVSAAATIASASARAGPSPNDTSMAEAMQAVETLVGIYGMDYETASLAVETVGADITTAYNFIIDNNLGKDTGGAVYPIDNCPHVAAHIRLTLANLAETASSHSCTPFDPNTVTCDYFRLEHASKGTSTKEAPQATNAKSTAGSSVGLKVETDEGGNCPAGENWLCLHCGVTRCSRYVNGHGVDHWKSTKAVSGTAGLPSRKQSIDDHPEMSFTEDEAGHCIAVSLSDLSVWCHECNAYLIDKEKIDPIVKSLQILKFGSVE